MLDRIDIHIEVPRVDYEKLNWDRVGESSESIRKRVQAARDIQNNRFDVRSLPTSVQRQETLHSVICNADIRVGEIRQFCQLQARTIADLAGSEEIQSSHLAEALRYRPMLIMGQ